MLQRIQTFFLLLALIAIAITFFMPIANISFDGKIISLYTNYGLMSLPPSGVPAVIDAGIICFIAGVVILLLLICLSQFKRRKIQILICRITYVALMLQMALNYFLPYSSIDKIKLVGKIVIENFGLAFYMPIVAIFFVLLAERFVKRDENLVRSADRLR